jgi:hypothetical protein
VSSDWGALCDVLIAVWSLSVAGIFIGIIGGMDYIADLARHFNSAGDAPPNGVQKDALVEALWNLDDLDYDGFLHLLQTCDYQGRPAQKIPLAWLGH